VVVLLAVALVAGVALIVAGQPKEPAAAGGGGTIVAPFPDPPSGLRASAGSFRVMLTWDEPPLEGVSYRISRDGGKIGETSRLRFADPHAMPGQDYRYDVVALAEAGPSDPATITVRTPAAPLALARLEGTFTVRITRTAAHGFLSLGPKRSRGGFTFTPVCDRWACDVRWAYLGLKAVDDRLRRSGDRYRGSDTGAFGTKCGAKRSTSTLSITIRVVAAGPVSDEWLATQIAGTLVERVPAQLGCEKGVIRSSFTGVRA
jgi:hypothetical protein